MGAVHREAATRMAVERELCEAMRSEVELMSRGMEFNLMRGRMNDEELMQERVHKSKLNYMAL